MSNENGDFLFYSSGYAVWNKNHQLMPNSKDFVQWTGSTQGVLALQKPTSNHLYYLYVKDNCKSYKIGRTISILDRPNFSLIKDTIVCNENTIILEPIFQSYKSSDTTYLWSTNDISKNITIDSEETYTLIIGEKNCKETKEVQVQYKDCSVEFSIPNIITPNGDQYNEQFSFSGVEEYLYQLIIFNQWGKEIFKDDYYQGKWNGEGLNDGNYYYQIKNIKDNSLYKGWVKIVR